MELSAGNFTRWVDVNHQHHGHGARVQRAQAMHAQSNHDTENVMDMTTLGWLKHSKGPQFPWFEWHYLHFIKKCLTTDWKQIQGGSGDETMQIIIEIFNVLELNTKARMDFTLLMHTGPVGRTLANKLMWTLLSDWALDDRYLDLSSNVSWECYKARRTFERPEWRGEDLRRWTWEHLDHCKNADWHWHPAAVPGEFYQVVLGPQGEPLPPPRCWLMV